MKKPRASLVSALLVTASWYPLTSVHAVEAEKPVRCTGKVLNDDIFIDPYEGYSLVSLSGSAALSLAVRDEETRCLNV